MNMNMNSLKSLISSKSISIGLFIIIITIFLDFISVKQGFCFNVTAQADRNKISINDSISLSIIFEDGSGDVDISAITDFTVVSQSSSSSISIINGKYSKSITAVYTLIPKKTGVLEIPPLNVKNEGKIYKTQKMTIEVSKQAAAHSNSGDIFLESGISAASLFIGQQAVYQLRFYSAVKLSNAALNPPSFKGFTAKEAEDRKTYTATINGRAYYVTEINYIIIPELSGEIEIEPALITCDVPVRDKRRSRDPFDDPFFSNGFFSFSRTETRRFSTDSIMVKVEPLPPYPPLNSSNSNSSPSSDSIPFSGLVGSFSIKAELDNNKIKTGDSATLTITVSGKGNIMDAQSPFVDIPSEFKIYDDSPEEKIELTNNGYSGNKTFKKAIVPVQSGKYTIKPINLSFFNISAHKYEILSTNPIEVEVENPTQDNQKDNQQNSSVANSNNLNNSSTDQTHNSSQNSNPNLNSLIKKKKVEFTGRDILSIKEDFSLLTPKNKLNFNMFLFLFFLPCFLFFLFKLVIRFKQKEINISDAMLKRAKMSLKSAEETLNKAEIEDRAAIELKDSNSLKESKKLNESKKFVSDEFFKFINDALTAIIIYKNSLNKKSAIVNFSKNIKDNGNNINALGTITAEEINEILLCAGSSKEDIQESLELLNEIESARYGRQEKNLDYHYTILERADKLFKSLAADKPSKSPAADKPSKNLDSEKFFKNLSGVILIFISSVLNFTLLCAFMLSLLYIYPYKCYADELSPLKAQTLFLEAVKDYHNGNFKESAEKFSSIAHNIHNPYLYYNIGNAYIKAQDIGHAVLWYERAKKEIPLDPDLNFNLDYAGRFVTDKIESSTIDILNLIFFWKDYFPQETVRYFVLFLSFIFFGYAAIRLFKQKKIFTPAGIVIFIILIISGFTALYSYYNTHSDSFAVIISKEASVRSGSSENATELFILHSGTKVKVKEKNEDHLKIVFSKDKIGWVSLNDAEMI